MTVNELIAALEAATEGGLELDGAIYAACLLNTDKRYLTDDPRAADDYTTSLDAKLPWENIVSVRHCEDGLWRAFHYDENGGHAATARTEPLARRIAALKARIGG